MWRAVTGIIKLRSMATPIKLIFFIYISVGRSIFWLRKSEQQQINLEINEPFMPTRPLGADDDCELSKCMISYETLQSG